MKIRKYDPRVQRWLEFFLFHTNALEYRKGSATAGTDFPSRLPLATTKHTHTRVGRLTDPDDVVVNIVRLCASTAAYTLELHPHKRADTDNVSSAAHRFSSDFEHRDGSTDRVTYAQRSHSEGPTPAGRRT